ncbi:hypothetical protein ACIA5D_14500 [Actinoplanes sp. NPDC051513]
MSEPVTREVVLDVTLPAVRSTGRVEVREILLGPAEQAEMTFLEA